MAVAAAIADKHSASAGDKEPDLYSGYIKSSAKKASDLMVEALENEGVKYVFGVPGEENLDLLESLRTSKIQMITTRHEATATFMAAAYGRLTGKVSCVMVTLGPGATNTSTGLAYAKLAGTPLVIITGQKPIRTSKQGAFQMVDVSEHFKPITKRTRVLQDWTRIASEVREACRVATEPRPGPTHLELPEDIAELAISEAAYLLPRYRPRRPVADEKAIKLATEMLLKAKHPLLVIGAGAQRTKTQKMLLEFVDATGIPFVTTQMGKGVVPEDHAQSLGTAALSAGDAVHAAIEYADVLVMIGHDKIEKPPVVMAGDHVRTVIHMNQTDAEVDEVYGPHWSVSGDIANSVWQLKGALAAARADKSAHSWTEEALAKGARVLVGHRREGAYYWPTLLEGVPHECAAYSDEVFGPLAVLEPYGTFEEAVDLVNESDFGLQAGVFTDDLRRAFYAYERIDAGGVVVGDVPSIRVDSQPYGGSKESGLGREGVRYAIDEHFTQLRIMTLKNISKLNPETLG